MEGAALVLEHERSDALSTQLHEMAKRGRAYAEQAKAPATLRAYQSDWRHFDSWSTGLPPCPRTRLMVATCEDDRAGMRDRALLLLGFGGAFRRSELVGLDVADLEFGTGGMTVTIPRSKSDQEGAGQRVGIPYGSNPETGPMRNVRAWLEVTAITAGPVFRAVNRWGHVAEVRLSDRVVALVVKRRAELAGLDPTCFGGHSLRAGLAMSAAEAGVGKRCIMNHTRHKSLPMVRRSIREVNLFRENAAGHVGL